MKTTFWDRMSKLYDRMIKKHDAIYVKTMDRTKSLLTDSDVVLDFACASGEMSVDLATHVKRVHGIDTSTRMIELADQKARDRQVGNTSFDQIDAFDQSLVRSSFTAVVGFNIFHLLDDAPKVLARLNDLLAEGGLLISQTPCLGERGWLLRSLINLVSKLRLGPTVRNLTFDELESLVSSSDFEIFETEIWDEKSAVQWIAARKI